ncbi:hypothetical protein SeMB42_g03842 [Synchytrium endobioticum]|uniref:Bet v I/Major latex protein domain-containing protein n=1 Tax=Synchytrium endobioticum TaxID=286115 RepID=A0A507CRJ8_9FUNG|nr:hypothetical protein SeLEV6574_g05932 [Synchytrium endobioticum]TPX46003.1 hypothetical protein SeMB42_g03842 [Synchytrium endobioticum]
MIIPSSATTLSSRVIPFPVEAVWKVIKTLDFKFWSLVKSTEMKSGCHPNEVGGMRTIYFKDGTTSVYQMAELSDLHHFVTWELVESEPSLQVMSSSSTLRLRRVTHDNSTFIEWTTYFPSADTTANAVEDAKYKHDLAFKDLMDYMKQHSTA